MIVNFLKDTGFKLAMLAGVILVMYTVALKGAYNHEHDLRVQTEQKLVVAQQQVALDNVALEESERRASIVANSNRELNNAISQILAAKGADELVPPDVANAWATGIDRLRDAGGYVPPADSVGQGSQRAVRETFASFGGSVDGITVSSFF